MGGDQQWLTPGGGRSKLACNDRARFRGQRLLQMFLLLHKNQIARPSLPNAGNARYIRGGITNETSGGELRQRFQGLWHEGVIAVASGQWLVTRIRGQRDSTIH